MGERRVLRGPAGSIAIQTDGKCYLSGGDTEPMYSVGWSSGKDQARPADGDIESEWPIHVGHTYPQHYLLDSGWVDMLAATDAALRTGAELVRTQAERDQAVKALGEAGDVVGAQRADIDRLSVELEKAHVFIGEMVLADMEPPLPPYGSEERAEAEVINDGTDLGEAGDG